MSMRIDSTQSREQGQLLGAARILVLPFSVFFWRVLAFDRGRSTRLRRGIIDRLASEESACFLSHLESLKNLCVFPGVLRCFRVIRRTVPTPGSQHAAATHRTSRPPLSHAARNLALARSPHAPRKALDHRPLPIRRPGSVRPLASRRTHPSSAARRLLLGARQPDSHFLLPARRFTLAARFHPRAARQSPIAARFPPSTHLPTAAACRALWMLACLEARPTTVESVTGARAEGADLYMSACSIMAPSTQHMNQLPEPDAPRPQCPVHLVHPKTSSPCTTHRQFQRRDARGGPHLHRLFMYADVEGSCGGQRRGRINRDDRYNEARVHSNYCSLWEYMWRLRRWTPGSMEWPSELRDCSISNHNFVVYVIVVRHHQNSGGT
ncbi:hypothetical protein GGX14DRAFT_402060 [Mycena pura]|uniref:Uncharacterized protein n=1 Tax=Mycena pura TaxID=153505 RepID=A0AAD6UZU6_9AGAR|nr:hypothetical protein GGX14DRAFT_402060 [Mycena pura]